MNLPVPTVKVRLLAQQIALLRAHADARTLLAGATLEPCIDGEVELALPVDKVLPLRNAFADRLIACGYDADYRSTAEGRAYEALLDRLFVAAERHADAETVHAPSRFGT
jgi:hypothetical protein